MKRRAMSPHRVKLAAALAMDTPAGAALVSSGLGALLWTIVTGYQLVLLVVVLVVQGVDLWAGAGHAERVGAYDPAILHSGVRKKLRRSFGYFLLAGCVDVVLLLVAQALGSFLVLIGADTVFAETARAAGSLGLVSASAMAGRSASIMWRTGPIGRSSACLMTKS